MNIMMVVLSVFALFVIFILSVFSSRCLLAILDFSDDSIRKTYPVLTVVLFIVYSVCCAAFFYFLPQPKAALYDFLNPPTEAKPEAKSDYPALGQHHENAEQTSALIIPPKEAIVPEHNNNSSQGNEEHPQEKNAAQQESAAVLPQSPSPPSVIEEPITPPSRPQLPPVTVESKQPVMITPSFKRDDNKDRKRKERSAHAKAEKSQKNTALKENSSCKRIKDTMDNIDREKISEIEKGITPTNILINPRNGNIYRVFPQSGQINTRCRSYLIHATINGKDMFCSETSCD